jgi:DNA topoisomerase III
VKVGKYRLAASVSRYARVVSAGANRNAVSRFVLQPAVIRKGASGTFHDKGLAGASHHAVIPNINTVEELRDVWPRLSGDERRLFGGPLLWPQSPGRETRSELDKDNPR